MDKIQKYDKCVVSNKRVGGILKIWYAQINFWESQCSNNLDISSCAKNELEIHLAKKIHRYIKFKNHFNLWLNLDLYSDFQTLNSKQEFKIIHKRVVSIKDRVGGKIVFEKLGVWPRLLE